MMDFLIDGGYSFVAHIPNTVFRALCGVNTNGKWVIVEGTLIEYSKEDGYKAAIQGLQNNPYFICPECKKRAKETL